MEEEIKEVVKPSHSIVQMTKGTTAVLDFCRGGKLFYYVDVDDTRYTFPIDVTNSGEVGQAIFIVKEKASMFRRYINMAIAALEGDEPDDMIRWYKL